MNIKRRTITVSGMEVEVVRKGIKNLHLGVYPPDGRVRVAVPQYISDEAVRLAIVSRLGWIRRQQKAFQEQQRQSLREYISGESHFFQGRRYRLKVIVEETRRAFVRIAGKTVLELHVSENSTRDRREAILTQWYREQLKVQLEKLLAKWQPKIGESVGEMRIRKMRTRWGSCNAEARRIWLNLELAKKPLTCIEYVLVHELIHLKERRHNDRFRELMENYLPTWRTRREELNRAPLAHEDWTY